MTYQRTGYALIELLIVIFIITLFSALSLAYYRSFDEQRKLDAGAKQLMEVLSLASKKANSSDLTPNSSCTDFRGYRVLIESPATYTLEFNCAESYQLIQRQTTQPGISLSGSGTSILFKPLSSGTNLTTEAAIVINNSSNGKCTVVQVNPIGTVERTSNCTPGAMPTATPTQPPPGATNTPTPANTNTPTPTSTNTPTPTRTPTPPPCRGIGQSCGIGLPACCAGLTCLPNGTCRQS